MFLLPSKPLKCCRRNSIYSAESMHFKLRPSYTGTISYEPTISPINSWISGIPMSYSYAHMKSCCMDAYFNISGFEQIKGFVSQITV